MEAFWTGNWLCLSKDPSTLRCLVRQPSCAASGSVGYKNSRPRPCQKCPVSYAKLQLDKICDEVIRHQLFRMADLSSIKPKLEPKNKPITFDSLSVLYVGTLQVMMR